MYEVPPITEFQLNDGDKVWLVALFAGKSKVGADIVCTPVVKLQTDDHALVLVAEEAFTRQ